jgi:cytidyltransferase-like protein
MSLSKQIIVSGGFEDIHSRHIRFLEEASKLGEVTVLLWEDKTLERQTGKAPKFPLAERLYFLEAVRYVSRVVPLPESADPNILSEINGLKPEVWVDEEGEFNTARRDYCNKRGLEYRVLMARQLGGFPELARLPAEAGRKKVIVTGSYDWFHSGHVRFLEEASGYGDLYVVVGHDANIRLLKGAGHPLLPQAERRYMVGAIKYVHQALISTGEGWLDADPEVELLKPDIYVVNEDGDKGGKREYCEKKGIQYLVLKRIPATGLPARSSTNLRGF